MTSALEHRLFGSLVQFLLGCLVIDIIGSNLVLAIGVPLGYVLSFCCLVPFFFNLSLYSWHARRVSFIATVLSLGVGVSTALKDPWKTQMFTVAKLQL